MKANNIKMQIIHEMKYDLKITKGHLLLKNPLFLQYLFCLESDLIKIYYEC